VLYWNQGAERVFGYARAEAIGQSLTALIVPGEHAAEGQQILSDTLVGGQVAAYESIRRRKDGSLVHVDISSKAVRDAHGGVEFVLWTKKDVTEIKVMREARLIEARFRDLLESTPDAIVIANPSGASC